MDWKRELVIAHLVKQKVSEVDFDQLWPNTIPNLATSLTRLTDLETKLGHKIDNQFAEFLSNADGWVSFYQNIDIFGVDDFYGGVRWNLAEELLQSLEPLEPICGFARNELLPFAVSTTDIDVMVIAKPSSRTPGVVMWMAGAHIDTFNGFNEWFLAMVDYNRQEYQRLVSKHG